MVTLKPYGVDAINVNINTIKKDILNYYTIMKIIKKVCFLANDINLGLQICKILLVSQLPLELTI